MIRSMTGFAARKGQGAGHSWTWDLRSVNGKGLDLRLRVPDWIDGLEQALRADLGHAVQRGNVSLTLKVTRDGAADGAEALRVNESALGAVLTALSRVEAAAMQVGVTLGQATAADVLAVRGVLETGVDAVDTGPLRAAIMAEFPALLSDFNAMRAAEGENLGTIILIQLEEIARLTHDAAAETATRQDAQAEGLKASLARVLSNAEGVDETRIAQELAVIAVKTDVTEELDRLAAHYSAATLLLADHAPIGRKLDFLMQEFMREANTLCSKAQSIGLTRIGLDLKTVIDQMREQVQNVE